MRRFAFLMVLVVVVLSEPVKLNILSELSSPGTSFAEIDGNRLYFANGRRVVVSDISDIEHPYELGAYFIPYNDISKRALEGEFEHKQTFFFDVIDSTVFISNKSTAYAIDFSDYANPEVLWEYCDHSAWSPPETEHDGWRIHKEGDFYLLTKRPSATETIVLNNRGEEIRSIPFDIKAKLNDSRYVIRNGYSFYIADISDTEAPFLTGDAFESIYDEINLSCITQGDSLLMVYRDSYDRHLALFDLSDPDMPSEIAHITDDERLYEYSMFGDRIFEGMRARGEDDISVYTIASDTIFYDTTLTGINFVHDIEGEVAVGNRFLASIDEDTIVKHSEYMMEEIITHRQSVEGDLLIEAGYGLRIWDISRPDHAYLLGKCDSVNGTINTIYMQTGMAIIGNTVFLKAGDDTIQVIDISDPRNPVKIDWPENPRAFGVDEYEGNLVLSTIDGLKIYNVDEPTAPELIGSNDSVNFIYSVIEDSLLYGWLGRESVFCVNLSDPTEPVLLWTGRTPSFLSWGQRPFDVEDSIIYIRIGSEIRYYTYRDSLFEIGTVPVSGVFGWYMIENDLFFKFDYLEGHLCIFQMEDGLPTDTLVEMNLIFDIYSFSYINSSMDPYSAPIVQVDIFDDILVLNLQTIIVLLDISRFNNEQEDIALSPGWNMVTPPFVLADSSLSAWFESVPGYYTFNTESGGYDTQEYLRQSIGVLTYSDVETTLTMTGDMIETVTFPLKEGWNMCGGPSFNIDTDQFAADSSIVMPVYILDAETRNYQETDRIQPGQGFWILSTEDHEFVIE